MDLSLNDEQQMLADSVRDLFSSTDGDPTAGERPPRLPSSSAVTSGPRLLRWA